MRIIIALLIFSGIILFHEFGHFLLARLNGVFVIEFSLGMGPRLLSHVSRKSGTRYSLKILPFGGSCAMRGEDDGDMSEGAFGRAKVWQRLLIVAAGPFFNFLLAFLGAVIIVTGAGYDAPYAEYLSEGYPAQEAGMERGDLITSVGGEKITVYRDFSGYISLHQKDFAAGKPDRELILAKPDGFIIMVPQNGNWAALIEDCWPDAKKFTRYAIRKDTRFDIAQLERIIRGLPAGILMHEKFRANSMVNY